MSDPRPQNPPDRLDDATTRRLGRLRTVPVDTSRLDRAILAQIPKPQQELSAWRHLRPRRAAAAMITVLAVLAAAFYASSSGPVMASPAEMLAIHEDLVAGRTPIVEVDSIADANAALEREWARAPQVPHVPEPHVMACCTRDVQDKRMACVLLRSEGVPVTMAVARAGDMRHPPGERITRDGVTYLVHQQDDIAMVMHERDGRWVCLMGELPAGKLIDLAAGLRFAADRTFWRHPSF